MVAAVMTAKKPKKQAQAPEAVSEPRKEADDEKRRIMREMGSMGAKKRWSAAKAKKQAEEAAKPGDGPATADVPA